MRVDHITCIGTQNRVERKTNQSCKQYSCEAAQQKTAVASSDNDADDVMSEWHNYVVKQREEELQTIITEEKLKPEDTCKFIENAFRDGEIKTTGTDIDKLLPPVSRFGGGNRAEMKKGVIDRLMAYFERFYGMTNAKFNSEDETML